MAHRGLPDLPTRYMVIEVASGTDHGAWDSLAEVGAALACAKLVPDDVEIIVDGSPLARFTDR